MTGRCNSSVPAAMSPLYPLAQGHLHHHHPHTLGRVPAHMGLGAPDSQPGLGVSLCEWPWGDLPSAGPILHLHSVPRTGRHPAPSHPALGHILRPDLTSGPHPAPRSALGTQKLWMDETRLGPGRDSDLLEHVWSHHVSIRNVSRAVMLVPGECVQNHHTGLSGVCPEP